MEPVAVRTLTRPIREHFDPKNCGQVGLALPAGPTSQLESAV